jgi:poly-gamma-glutamate synthesis protein (capsule biosynthesis protein)
MLGRSVGEHLGTHPGRTLFGEDLLEVLAATDGMVLNLECCISDGGVPWPGRVFHFRAPPSAADALHLLGVRCVTLANNHAMDFGEHALLDTLDHLSRAGIAVAGAGRNVESARAPVPVTVGRQAITVVSFTDDPAEYAAAADHPGVAWVDPADMVPSWLTAGVRDMSRSGAFVLVSPHWGPNMIEHPLHRVRRAAADLITAGASIIAGHSAHVFHGVHGPVLFDLGDFVDDYAVGPLRNDLSLLWLVTMDDAGPSSVEAVPLRLTYCHTTLADGEDKRWIRERFRRACRAPGTEVTDHDGRLVVQLTGR